MKNIVFIVLFSLLLNNIYAQNVPDKKSPTVRFTESTYTPMGPLEGYGTIAKTPNQKEVSYFNIRIGGDKGVKYEFKEGVDEWDMDAHSLSDTALYNFKIKQAPYSNNVHESKVDIVISFFDNDNKLIDTIISSLPYNVPRLSVISIGTKPADFQDKFYPDTDARDFIQSLCDISKKNYNIDSTLIIKSQADSAKLVSTLCSFEDIKVKEGDTFVLFLSGHGISPKKSQHAPDSRENNLGLYSFLCYDYSSSANENKETRVIQEKDLEKFCKTIVKKGGIVWLFINTCYSGDFITTMISTMRDFDCAAGSLSIITATEPNSTNYQLAAVANGQSEFPKKVIKDVMENNKDELTYKQFENYFPGTNKATWGKFTNQNKADVPYLSTSREATPVPHYFLTGTLSTDLMYAQVDFGYCFESSKPFPNNLMLSLGLRYYTQNNPILIPNTKEDVFMYGTLGNFSLGLGVGYRFGPFLPVINISSGRAVRKGDTTLFDESGEEISTESPRVLLNLNQKYTSITTPDIVNCVITVSPGLNIRFGYFTKAELARHLVFNVGYNFYIDIGKDFPNLNSFRNQHWTTGIGWEF